MSNILKKVEQSIKDATAVDQITVNTSVTLTGINASRYHMVTSVLQALRPATTEAELIEYLLISGVEREIERMAYAEQLGDQIASRTNNP